MRPLGVRVAAQKSGDLRAGGSVEVGTLNTDPDVFMGIIKAIADRLVSMVDSCPKEDPLIILGATTGTDRDAYESCIGPHSSGSEDETSSILLDFAKIRRLKIAGP